MLVAVDGSQGAQKALDWALSVEWQLMVFVKRKGADRAQRRVVTVLPRDA